MARGMKEVMRDCDLVLASLDPLHRCKVVEDLLVCRLLRKSQRVRDMWEATAHDWNETFYRMTAYAMGAPRNSQPFVKLASLATYHMCLKERSSLTSVEALLLGTAGMLSGEYYDDYVLRLQDEYVHLANKYHLSSMVGGEWQRGGNYPAGNPTRRLVQMAALVSKDNYSMDGVVAIGSLAEVEQFFGVRLSDFWRRRFALGGRECGGGVTMGSSKVYMMAINLVVPMLFAYGSVLGDDGMKMRAMDLLESIPAEHNRKVARWTGAGVPCSSAYESQALIELTDLCAEQGCERCPLAKYCRAKGE